MSYGGPHSHRESDQHRQIVDNWRQSDGPAEAIIEATAAVTNSQPTELPPLQEYADVDSLDALLTASDSVEIAFEYDRVTVRIAADGKLVVEIDSQP